MNVTFGTPVGLYSRGVCENSPVDPGKGYNRTLRKVLHIAAGLPALAVPCLPSWVVLAATVVLLVAAYWLKPRHAWWMRYISKPADRRRNVITGLRSFAGTLFLLAVVWFCLDRLGPGDPSYSRYVMLGWLALALGDGLAGLVGPGPKVARTVPWNKYKTWWGMIGCFGGVLLAYGLSIAVPYPPPPPLGMAALLSGGLLTAAAIALLESVRFKLDDNYTVGLGAAIVAFAVHAAIG